MMTYINFVNDQISCINVYDKITLFVVKVIKYPAFKEKSTGNVQLIIFSPLIIFKVCPNLITNNFKLGIILEILSLTLLSGNTLSLSPHIGAATLEAQDRIGIELAEKIKEILK